MTFLDSYKGTLLSKLINKDKANTMKVISYLLERLNDNFNMNLKLNQSQITTISFDLMHKFREETIEDILLFFKMARMGELGSKMHRLDSHVIFNEWFPEYMNLKSTNREDLIRDKKDNVKMDLLSKNSWSDHNKKKLQGIIDSFDVKKKESKDFNKKTEKPYLDNAQELLIKLSDDVKTMSKKELLEFKEFCSNRQFHEKYLKIAEDEIELRNTKRK